MCVFCCLCSLTSSAGFVLPAEDGVCTHARGCRNDGVAHDTAAAHARHRHAHDPAAALGVPRRPARCPVAWLLSGWWWWYLCCALACRVCKHAVEGGPNTTGTIYPRSAYVVTDCKSACTLILTHTVNMAARPNACEQAVLPPLTPLLRRRPRLRPPHPRLPQRRHQRRQHQHLLCPLRLGRVLRWRPCASCDQPQGGRRRTGAPWPAWQCIGWLGRTAAWTVATPRTARVPRGVTACAHHTCSTPATHRQQFHTIRWQRRHKISQRLGRRVLAQCHALR